MTDTPALTAERRAQTIALQIVPGNGPVDEVLAAYNRARALIASAIREAENAAYERAAAIADVRNVGGLGTDDYDAGRYAVAGEIAAAILALKSQKETP